MEPVEIGELASERRLTISDGEASHGVHTTVRAKNQRAAAWCGPIAMVLLFAGLLGMARLIPPPSPALNALQIATIFHHHTALTLWGLILANIGGTLMAPFFVLISLQMRRVEGEWGLLTSIQAVLAGMFVLAWILSLMVLDEIVFRSGLPITTIQMLDDIVWLIFVGFTYTAILQLSVIGLAILQDRGGAPLFPRWVGYLNLAVAATWVPGTFDVFFKSGPLAWNGLFAWWVPLSSFAVWIPVMTGALLSAINKQESEAADDHHLSNYQRHIEALSR